MTERAASEATCAGCKWWSEVDRWRVQGRYGECRRYPPIREYHPDGLTACRGAFPMTHATDHCGEHAAKEQ